jgi:hypothetical protein
MNLPQTREVDGLRFARPGQQSGTGLRRARKQAVATFPGSNARAVISSKAADYHGKRAVRLPWVVTAGAEVAGLQATDLIDALVQSCTGGRTEPLGRVGF